MLRLWALRSLLPGVGLVTRARPLEVKALVPLLEQDWATPEELAEALIAALDDARAGRTSYIGIMQFGREKPIYVGLGPYPGLTSARNALAKHPAVTEATARAVVPVIGPEGFEQLLKKVG